MKALTRLFAAAALAAAAGILPAHAAPETPEAPASAATGTHIELAGEAIELMSSFVDALAAAKDVEGARGAVTKFDAIASDFEALAPRMVAAGRPTGAQKEKVDAMFRAAEKNLEKRMGETFGVLLSNQEVAEILGSALEKFGQRMERLEVMEQWTQGARDEGSEDSDASPAEKEAAEPDTREISPEPEATKEKAKE